MKLFAKRKRTVAVAKTEEKNKSDPVVEELLKKDPSTWNAKQRRMVKRYQDRKVEGATKPVEEAAVVASPTEATSENINDGADEVVAQSASSSDSESDSDSSSVSDEEIEAEATGQAAAALEKESATPKDTQTEDDKGNDNLESSGTIDDLNLDGLNSKQRRTLTRKLERGAATFADVQREADEMRAANKPEESEPTAPASKKRKKDWSHLSPEERKRREEQRQKQQEAAERRERGESSPHKHPLNSERRRANRRKPKWRKTGASGNEHDTSGFQMRQFKRKQPAY